MGSGMLLIAILKVVTCNVDVKCGAAGVGLTGPHPVTHHAGSAQPKHVTLAYAVQMYFDVSSVTAKLGNGGLKASHGYCVKLMQVSDSYVVKGTMYLWI